MVAPQKKMKPIFAAELLEDRAVLECLSEYSFLKLPKCFLCTGSTSLDYKFESVSKGKKGN